MADATAAPVRVFVSYSSGDKEDFQELLSYLVPLEERGLIALYHDQLLRAGDDWEALLSDYIDNAAIVLALLSDEYLASISAMRESERAFARKKRVVPVIVRPCRWQETVFRKLQALPTSATPISEWPSRPLAFVDVVTAVRRMIRFLDNAPEAASQSAAATPHTVASQSPAPAAPPTQPPARLRTLADYRFSSEAARVVAGAETVEPSRDDLTSEALLYAAFSHGEDADKTSSFFYDLVADMSPLVSAFPSTPVFPARVEKLGPRELTTAATRLMEIAQHAAIATTGGRVISLRHLMFGLVQPIPDSGKDKLLVTLGIDLATLTARYVDYLRKEVPLSDELPAWERLVRRTANERELSAYRPSYAADYVAATEDQLGFTKDARALASLIASSQTRPPLSIGLFGDWGSGKSFFMRQIRDLVASTAERAASALAAKRTTAYYSKIVQIEFNAWHYIEGNLWASLVEHIFSNLRLRPDSRGDDAEVERKRIELLKLLEVEKQQQEAAHAARKAAQTAADNARVKRTEKIEARVRLELTKHNDWAAAFSAGELAELGLTAKTRDAIGKLRDRGKVWWVLGGRLVAAARLFGQRHRGGTLLFAFLVLLATAALPLAAWSIAAYIGIARIREVVATAVAAGVALTSWLAPWAARAGKVAAAVEAKHRELELRREKEAIAIDQEIAALSRDAEAAELKALEASQRIVDLNAQLAALSTTSIFSTFLEERASSADYRRHLGILANIRRDFERMAHLLEKQREDPDALIQRIVLYIDDLDRCPARRVVEVLQAIHLLLAFPVFVVVVGVDTRVIVRALRSEYEMMFGGADDSHGDSIGAEPTPHDYLQKIFQVPFWIRPMNADSCRQLLTALTKRQPDVAARSAGAPEIAGIAEVRLEDSSLVPLIEEPPAEDQMETRREAVKAALSAPKREDDLNPLALHTLDHEITLMERVTPLLGRSPRAVKRFVNCYQLIKIGLEPSEIGPFLTDPAADVFYKPVMFLLAAVTGAAELGEKLLDSLDDPAVSAMADVNVVMQTWPIRFGSSFTKERELIAAALAEEAKLDPEAWRPEALRNAARVVRRYTFRAGYAAVQTKDAKESKRETPRGADEPPVADATL